VRADLTASTNSQLRLAGSSKVLASGQIFVMESSIIFVPQTPVEVNHRHPWASCVRVHVAYARIAVSVKKILGAYAPGTRHVLHRKPSMSSLRMDSGRSSRSSTCGPISNPGDY
jgi:hypothetical protein